MQIHQDLVGFKPKKSIIKVKSEDIGRTGVDLGDILTLIWLVLAGPNLGIITEVNLLRISILIKKALRRNYS